MVSLIHRIFKDKIAKTKTADNLDAIMYLKKYDDNIYIVEEVRVGKKTLVPKTMYKNKLGHNVETFGKKRWIG